MVGGADGFYSPGKIKLLLWRYDDLVALTKVVVQPDRESASVQRTVSDVGEGGFEEGLCIRSDIEWALGSLEPAVRRVVWDYYVAGYAAVEIAAAVPGINRWFVDRARHRGIRQMALSLGWKPKRKTIAAQDLDEFLQEARDVLTAQELHERMRMIVARSLRSCPTIGPKGMRCPVLDCTGLFDLETGSHVQELQEIAA